MKKIFVLILIFCIGHDQAQCDEVVSPIAVESGVETSHIDWGSAIPQIESHVINRLKGGRIMKVIPIAFSVCFRDRMLAENLILKIQYIIPYDTVDELIAQGGDTKCGEIMGIFFRYPYASNGEWTPTPPSPSRGKDQLDGWVPISTVKKQPSVLFNLIKTGFHWSVWPTSTDKDSAVWLKCVIFQAGCESLDCPELVSLLSDYEKSSQ